MTQTNWDQFVAAQDGHILQSTAWGELKQAFGWRARTVTVEEDGQIRAGALVLFRPLPFGLGSIAYIPRGPVVEWANTTIVRRLLDEIDQVARAEKAILLKVEPDVEDGPQIHQILTQPGFIESPQTIQPPRTILINVTQEDEAIMAAMNQGTRRKIRTSERKEVVVRRGDANDLDSFNRLIQSTGTRNEFGVHSAEYYQKAFQLFAPDRVVLLMASCEGHDLGGLMVFAQGSRAWYFYGASSDQERNRMATYGLQWAAIQWAGEKGCTTYDLWGIPDEDEETLEAQFQDRSAGLWGVYGFKRGFGGQVMRTAGAWDRVYRPLLYQVYKLYLALRSQNDED